MAGTVTVTILGVSSVERPPSTAIDYEVVNESREPVWLVDDGWLIWRQTGDEIRLSYARGPMQPGSHVFGYFNPAVVQLAPAERTARVARLTWPQRLDQLWNARAEAAPEPGNYRVTVSVGYGETPEPHGPALGEGVEAPVLRWQRVATSEPVPMRVPVYQP
jgi:hypothetical protein